MQRFTYKPLIALGICLGVSLISTSAVFAGEVTITGQNGKTTTVDTNTTKNGNTLTRDRTVTYPNGQTRSSTGTYTLDGNGGYDGAVTRTNRNGQTSTVQVDGQRTRTGSTVTNTGTVTGVNGKQTTYNHTGSCTGGNCTGSTTTTFSDGKTRTRTTTGTRDGNGGYAGTTTVTGRNGNTHTGTFQRSR
jgi:hypothetical protein